MSTGRVVIITGTVPRDLDATSRVLAYFIALGCQIQSSNLHEKTFLYTLIKPDIFWVVTDQYLKILRGVERSVDFSVTYA